MRVERLDHLGLLAAVMKDLGLIDTIDTRLVPDEQEVITPGQASDLLPRLFGELRRGRRPSSPSPFFVRERESQEPQGSAS